MHFPQGKGGIYTGAAGSGTENLPATETCKERHSTEKETQKETKQITRQSAGAGSWREGRVGGWQSWQDRSRRAGQGEDGGKVTSRTVWFPSRALGEKNPPATQATYP